MSSQAIEPEDLRALARLDREAFDHDAYSAMTLRQLWDVAGPLFSSIRADGKVVGYGVALPTVGETGEAWFMSLVVARDHRRQGLGRQLMQEILYQCEKLGYNTVRLTVNASNGPMITLCRSFSFRIEHEASEYFGPGEDRLVMVRTA